MNKDEILEKSRAENHDEREVAMVFTSIRHFRH